MIAAVAAASTGDGPRASPSPMTEVIVTLKGAPLSAFGRSLTSARHRTYESQQAAAQRKAIDNVRSAIPSSRISWRYRLVANGFAVVIPKSDIGRLKQVPGVDKVWPNVTYHSLAASSPELIGADELWGTTLSSAGQGIKIGIIDDGIDVKHRFFDPSGYQYPPGFPKGQTQYTTPKVIVARAVPRPDATWKYARVPFDPEESFHGTHVAGIAAGNNGVIDGDASMTGVAPAAYLGNYKVLTTPTPEFDLDGNSAEIAAAIEAAVADGMNVINLSLGEPEIEPSRDLVVQAIDAAAAAGVVPVVAAGNDFFEYGYGTISSPANASGAIAVAATDKKNAIAGFSSGGPTPVSLVLKPDISAPGVDITSALPGHQGGPWGSMSGTSMATPQVAGGAALLMQLHRDWTVAQIKSALVQTADPVLGKGGREVPTTREGGGLIDLRRATNPLVFASPTALSFPVNGGIRAVALTDAGAGAGSWSVSIEPQQNAPGIAFQAASAVTVPGRLAVSARVSASAASGDITGFVVLTRGADTRRIPFWVAVSHPVLARERHIELVEPGLHAGTTLGGPTRISRYRYPTGEGTYPGPEAAYRVRITSQVANFGVAVVSGRAVPHVVFGGDENHLLGNVGLPLSINPYLSDFGETRPIAGAILPLPGTYDVVFDTPSEAPSGPFKFRFWVNDTTPPQLRIEPRAPAKKIWLSATDDGAGVDPASAQATIDGRPVATSWAAGRLVLSTTPGAHKLRVQVSDYQEAKNMEDVAAVLPNTATVTRTVRVG